MKTYANPTHAFIDSLESILDDGAVITVRGSEVREVIQRGFCISRPWERFITPVGRHGNPFASVAETLWVLAGHDDIQFLHAYMPKAAHGNSDNGVSWRAAYGPRLRNWRNDETTNGVDQLAEVVNLLRSDPATRRAALSIFNPSLDFIESRDIPCNNWIHALIRNGKLNISVAVRSNDIWFGFSHINLFEWSVLLDALAHWTGCEAGEYATLIGSFHIYNRHEEYARNVLAHWRGKTIYDFGIPAVRFDTDFNRLDADLASWFSAEDDARNGKIEEAVTKANQFGDFLGSSLQMSAIWHCVKSNKSDLIIRILRDMPENDFKAAAADWLVRNKHCTIDSPVWGQKIRAYLSFTAKTM